MRTKSPKRWYVVADAGRAAAYARREHGSGYDQVASWISDLVLPKDQRPAFADQAGRVFDSIGHARHAAATTSPQELAKQAFGRALAQNLNEAHAGGAFGALVLYAAPRLMGDLRHHLDKPTVAAIVHSAAQDLTKLPSAELYAAFDEVGLATRPRRASPTQSRSGGR